MKNIKRFVAALLCLIMLMQPVAFAASVADFLDFPQNWSKDAMTSAVENGLIVGKGNKRVAPDDNLTRAELAAIISRAFGATKMADISKLTDVTADDWFYADVAKAYQMGALTGTSDTTFDPEADITREEVFLVIARVLCLSSEDTSVLDKFTDGDKISSWAKNALSAMVADGYVNGYPNGSFQPQRAISRAELAQVFHNIFKTYISTPGAVSVVNTNGSVVVRTPGVHLQNVTINGDLVIADGVGAGDFDLTGVTVNGRILLRGGEGKVTFKNVKVTEGVVVYDLNGTVNFNNYRSEEPFKVLTEHTPATFLTATALGGSTGGGGSTKHKVTYYYSDGTVYQSKYVNRGTTAPELDLLDARLDNKLGLIPAYWSATQNGTEAFDFTTPIKKATKLYVVYTEAKYTVQFADKDNTVYPAATMTNVPRHEKLVFENLTYVPEKDRTFFKGWAVEPDAALEDRVLFTGKDYTIKGDITLYPVYSDKFLVTFINGGDMDVVEYERNDAIAAPDTNPTYPGHDDYQFKRWSTEEYGKTAYTFGTQITADVTLYAVYAYPIYVNGETTPVAYVEQNDKLTAPQAPDESDWPENKHFSHWSTTDNGEEFDFENTPITGPVTLYPVYKFNKHTVKFEVRGTVLDGFTKQYEYGTYATEIPVLDTDYPKVYEENNTQYTFAYWMDGTTQVNNIATYPITKDTTFKAIYTDKAIWTVTFTVPEGVTGVVGMPNPAEVPVINGNAVAKPSDPSLDGYTFRYWSETANTDTATAFDFTTEITSDITLYAIFDLITVTIKFYDLGEYDDQDKLVYTAPVAKGKTLSPETIEAVNAHLDAENGYHRRAELAEIYKTLGDPEPHKVNYTWWCIDIAEPEEIAAGMQLEDQWVPFDIYAPVSEDTVVFANTMILELFFSAPKLAGKDGWGITLDMPYNASVRAMDTAKDILFNEEEKAAIFAATDLVDNKVLDKIADRGLLEAEVINAGTKDETTVYHIKNIHKYVKLSTVLGPENTDKLIDEFVADYLKGNSDVTDRIKNYFKDINDSNRDTVTKDLQTALNGVLEVGDAEFINSLTPYMEDVLTSLDTDELIELILEYTESKLSTEDKSDEQIAADKKNITDLIDTALADFKKQNKDALFSFLYDFVIDEKDNLLVRALIDDLIVGEIKKGNYKTTLEFYLSTLSNADLRDNIQDVSDADFSLVVPTVKEYMNDSENTATVSAMLTELYGDGTTDFANLVKDQFADLTTTMTPGEIKDAVRTKLNSDPTFLGSVRTAIATYINDDERLKAVVLDNLDNSAVKDVIYDLVSAKLADKAFLKSTIVGNANYIADVQSTIIDVIENAQNLAKVAVGLYDKDADFKATVKEKFPPTYNDIQIKAELENTVINDSDFADTVRSEITPIVNDAGNIGTILDVVLAEGELYSKVENVISGKLNNTANLKPLFESEFEKPEFVDDVRSEINNVFGTDDAFLKSTISTMMNLENDNDPDDVLMELLRGYVQSAEVDYLGEMQAVIAGTGYMTKADFVDKAIVALSGTDDDTVDLRKNVVAKCLNTMLPGEDTANRATLEETLVDLIYDNTGDDDLFADGTPLYQVVDNAISAMLHDPDNENYHHIILDFINDIVNNSKFSLLSDIFVKSDALTREHLVTSLVTKMQSQGILPLLVTSFVSTQFVKGATVDIAIVKFMVAFIEDPANETAVDEMLATLIDNLTGEMLNYLVSQLGDDSENAQVKAVAKLKEELKSETDTKVTVTPENVFMFDPIYEALDKYSFDFFKSKLSPKAQALLPMSQIEILYNRYYGAYMSDMKNAMDVAKNPATPAGTEIYIGNGVQIDLNPINDVFAPMLEHAKKLEQTGLDKFVEADRLATYYKYYDMNPYKKAYYEFLDLEKWFDLVDAADAVSHTSKLSGYALRTVEDYYTIIEAVTLIVDDAIAWYYDDENVPEQDRNDVIYSAESKVLLVGNFVREFVLDYAVNGIPTTLTEVILRIETDPEMREYIERFGVDAYLDKIENNATANKVYDKAYEKIMARFGARIEALLDRVEGKLHHVLDGDDFDKGVKAVHKMFTPIADDMADVDEIFETLLKNIYAKEFEYNEITAKISRYFAYKLNEADDYLE